MFILKCCQASHTYCVWSVCGSSSDKHKPCSLKRCVRLPQLLPSYSPLLWDLILVQVSVRTIPWGRLLPGVRTMPWVPFWSTWIALLAAHLPARPLECAHRCVKRSLQQNSCQVLLDFMFLPVLWCSCVPCGVCAAPAAVSPQAGTTCGTMQFCGKWDSRSPNMLLLICNV